MLRVDQSPFLISDGVLPSFQTEITNFHRVPRNDWNIKEYLTAFC